MSKIDPKRLRSMLSLHTATIGPSFANNFCLSMKGFKRSTDSSLVCLFHGFLCAKSFQKFHNKRKIFNRKKHRRFATNFSPNFLTRKELTRVRSQQVKNIITLVNSVQQIAVVEMCFFARTNCFAFIKTTK